MPQRLCAPGYYLEQTLQRFGGRRSRACQQEAAPGLPPLISPAQNRAGRLHSLPPLQGGARRPQIGSHPGRLPAAAPLAPPAKRSSPVAKFGSCKRSLEGWRRGAEWAARCAPPVPGAECAPPPARRSSGRSERAARPRATSVRGPVASEAPVAACWEEAGAQRGRMELATGSQVRIWPPAAARTHPRPAFPLRLALRPALGWKRGPRLPRCGSGAPSPADAGAGTPRRCVRCLRLCHLERRGRVPPHAGARRWPGWGLGVVRWVAAAASPGSG